LATALVEHMGARVLVTGDDRLRSMRPYLTGDWVDLDERTPVLYYRIEALRRCDLFVGAHSGLWETVNLAREPFTTPALQVFGSRDLYEGRIRSPYRDYVTIGGRDDLALVMATFRRPDLRPFVLDQPHTAEKILAFARELVSTSASARAAVAEA